MNIQANYLDNLHNFLKGINRFYKHFDRREIEHKIIWQEGSTRVINYSLSNHQKNTCLFFIPSLINKSYILDLTEKTSIIKYFANLGYKVYLLDFTEPLENESNMKLDDYAQRVKRAFKELCSPAETITIGYCLGGILSLKLSEDFIFAGQVLIATPWDFNHLKRSFALDNALILQNFINISKQLNKVPAAMVQLFFSYLNSERIWYKFCQFAEMNNPNEIDDFLSLEQWVNDGLSLSRAFAIESLQMIANNSLNVPTDSKIPTFALWGEEDKIVPSSSCLPLYQQLPNKIILSEKTGHIGLIISKIARNRIWPEMARWMESII